MTQVEKMAADLGWSKDNGFTMSAYSRMVRGVKRVIVLRPDRSGWRLLVDGEELVSGTFRECIRAAETI